jgi:hypothetical protein
MIKKNQEIEIDENDIFKNDKLQRKDSIEDLSKLIISNTEPLVLSINASWGSGKTTFVKLWQKYLKKECNVNSIYFSAWEDDFSKEPLISILGEIKKNINEKFYADPKVEESFEKVKNIGGKVLKRGIPAFLKGITAGVVDFDKGFGEALGAIAESSAKELIDNYSKDKEITIEFKSSIEELLSKINNEIPFVIFIDELDRCRPLYSIELLERIKHIFGIKRLIFVLSIDKSQLSESIKSQYGDIDTDNYLRRFIDLEYHMNTPLLEDFCNYLYSDIYQFKEIFESKNIIKMYDKSLDELAMIKYLTKSLDFSLREIEQLFMQLRIIFSTVELKFLETHFRIIVLFIIIKLKLPNEYKLLINGKADEIKLKELLIHDKQKKGKENLELIIKAVILATAKDDLELKRIIENEEKIYKEIVKNEEKYKQECLIALLIIGHGDTSDYKLNQVIATVIKKIEFADKFNFDTV